MTPRPLRKAVRRAVKPRLARKAMWMLVGTGSAMLVGRLVQRALDAGWRTMRDDDPPTGDMRTDERWREALLWTVATGVVVSVAQLLTERGAVLGWRAVTGTHPPR